MSRTKAVWYAIVAGTGYHLPNFKAKKYVVHMALNLPREPDRLLYVDMTPDQAESLGKQLIENAVAVRKLNHE